MQSDEALGEKILTVVSEKIAVAIEQVVKNYLPKIAPLVPFQYRMAINRFSVNSFMTGVRNVLQQLPSDVKRDIAVSVKYSLDDISDEYMHSVMVGKPSKSLGTMLEQMGEIKWNEI